MTRSLNTIAVIPDGNRRFAKKHALSFQGAYLKGFEKAEEFVRWTGESGETKAVTFWAMSLDNFMKRSQIELKILFKLMQKRVEKSIESREFEDEGVRVNFFGKLELLPETLRQKMLALEEQTRDGGRAMNVGLAYNGREEIMQAARRLAFDLKNGLVTAEESALDNYLYLKEKQDLIIRTGNAQRLSGFLPLQSEYAEIYFSKKLWPEFARSDYDAAVDFFKQSEARYGK